MNDTTIQIANAFSIKINGNDLPANLESALTSAEVEQRLNGPSRAVLTFHDSATEGDSIMDEGALDLGAALSVAAKGSMSDSLVDLFKGEITSLDFELEAGGSFVVVTAHGKLQRAYHETKSNARLKVSYADIVSDIASSHGLRGDVDGPSHTHEHVPQGWLTDGEMLERLAAESGCVFFDWDEKLHFKQPSWSASSGVILVHGENLLRFRSSTTSAPAATKVEVRGWDARTKEAIVGTSTTVKTNGVKLEKDPAAAYKAYAGEAPLVVAAPAIPTTGAARGLAQVVADRIGDAASTADGLAIGTPTIAPDKTIKIGKAPNAVKGEYYVTAARHVFLSGEYQTEFRCSGALPTALPDALSLASGATGSAAARPLQNPGLVVLQGIVTNNEYAKAEADHVKADTPSVKVKFPTLSADKESDWYRVVLPGAGKDQGMLFMPEVGDEVLVAFAHGDLRTGYVLGGLYNGVDSPGGQLAKGAKDELGADLLPVSNGAINRRGLVSRSGHQIILDDSDGKERVLVIDKTGQQKLLFVAKDKTVVVESHENKVFIDGQSKKIDITSKGDITLKADGSINLEAMKDVVMKSTGKTTMQASQDFEVKGMNVKVNGDMAAEVKGGMNAKLEGGAQAVVKGGIVQIN